MNSPPCRPRAFLLDLDGVLVDSTPVHVAAYQHAFGQHALPLPESALNLVTQGASRAQVLAQAGVPPGLFAAVIETKHAAVLRSIALGALTPSQDVMGFLKQLARAETRVALVSNSSTAGLWVGANQLQWAFDAVIDGTQITSPKPAPDGYITAATVLGVTPSCCVAVEDSLFGAQAARSAGAFVVTLGRLVPPARTDLRVDSLSEIPLDSWMDLPRSEP